jgi:uracil-DNA glycosylase
MVENLSLEWRNKLKEEFQKPYFKELEEFVQNAYSNETCFPKKEYVFEAFNQCNLADVKVVLLGQDPYHDIGQAHGLSFSVMDRVKHPPSLKNIFKELETDVDFIVPDSGNLSHWAKQGVLLLNATLTVEAHKAGSHQKKGWEKFTDAVIEIISEDCEDVVFLLWGGYAQKKGKKINASKHCILRSGHPSPLSANRGYWFGNKHFSKTNTFLKSKNKTEISW